MLIKNAQLNHDQLTQLDLLSEHCKRIDNNVVAVYPHLLTQNRQRLANILYYDQPNTNNQKLIGFLSAFFFQKHVCEIGLMVSPDKRRQTLATQMLKAILPLAQSEGIQQFLFSSPHQLNDSWFQTLGLQYQKSEFQMHRINNTVESNNFASHKIHLATPHDIPALQSIDKTCFPHQENEHLTDFEELLQSPIHSLFMIKQNGLAVGKAHINWQPKEARFTDIAIIPAYQKNGLATALLNYCIHEVQSKYQYNIVLDVETKNLNALNLYTRLGFIISNAYDYWMIDQFGLTDFLQHL